MSHFYTLYVLHDINMYVLLEKLLKLLMGFYWSCFHILLYVYACYIYFHLSQLLNSSDYGDFCQTLLPRKNKLLIKYFLRDFIMSLNKVDVLRGCKYICDYAFDLHCIQHTFKDDKAKVSNL